MLGFKHKGFKEGLSKDYIQPRMTMITPIDKTDDELFKTLNVVIVLKLDWRLNEVLKLNTQIVKGLKHLRN